MAVLLGEGSHYAHKAYKTYSLHNAKNKLSVILAKARITDNFVNYGGK